MSKKSVCVRVDSEVYQILKAIKDGAKLPSMSKAVKAVLEQAK